VRRRSFCANSRVLRQGFTLSRIGCLCDTGCQIWQPVKKWFRVNRSLYFEINLVRRRVAIVAVDPTAISRFATNRRFVSCQQHCA